MNVMLDEAYHLTVRFFTTCSRLPLINEGAVIFHILLSISHSTESQDQSNKSVSMDKLKKALSGDDEDEEKGIVTQISDASTLSWSTRIKGFIVCFALGVILSLLGSSLLFIPKKGLTIFAVLYTFGNLLSLLSTCFLMGPLNQLKKMFAKTRIIATILVVVMFVLTLVCALALKNAGLAIICCVVQFLALTWYSLSYIPFARDAVKKCFAGCVD